MRKLINYIDIYLCYHNLFFKKAKLFLFKFMNKIKYFII